jgi:hypothetical protein
VGYGVREKHIGISKQRTQKLVADGLVDSQEACIDIQTLVDRCLHISVITIQEKGNGNVTYAGLTLKLKR